MVQQRARLYLHWIPPIVWAAVIFAASTELLASDATGRLLAAAVNAILGHPLPPSQFAALHFAVRKAGHLIEYFILSWLLFRAIRGDRTGWNVRWALAAIVTAALYAASDEWHQSFVL